MCAGVVPQHPPRIEAPRPNQPAARAAYSSGARTGVTGQPECGSTSPMCAYAPNGSPLAAAAPSPTSTPAGGTQLIRAARAPADRASRKKAPRSSPLRIEPTGIASAVTHTANPDAAAATAAAGHMADASVV